MTASTNGSKDKAPAKKAAQKAADTTRVNSNQTDKTEKKTMTIDKASQKKFEQLHQDSLAAGQEGFQALVESGNILARGTESLFKSYVSWTQTAAERNTQAFKSLLGCKTLNELTDVQNRVAKENLDDFLSGVAELSELGVKVATDALEPLGDQFGKTMRKVQDAMAA